MKHWRYILLLSVLLSAVEHGFATTVRRVIASQDSLQDFGVNQFSQTTNFSTEVTTLIGVGSTTNREIRYAIACILPAITAAQVVSCSLYIYMTNDQAVSAPTPLYRSAPITQSWTLAQTSWDNRKTDSVWTTAGITVGATSDSVRGNQGDSIYYRWNVTAAIIAQINGTAFGVRIAVKDTAVYPYRQTWATEDNTNSAMRPYFALNYVAAPAPPVLTTPDSAATGINNRPTIFVWQASTSADSYRVRIATSADFTEIVLDTLFAQVQTFSYNSLGYGTQYFWQVRAGDRGQWSAYSNTWKFTTVAAPPSTGIIRLVIASQDSLEDFSVWVGDPTQNYSTTAAENIGTGIAVDEDVYRYGIRATLPELAATQILSCSLYVFCLTDAGLSTATFYAAPISEPWILKETSWIMRTTGIAWETMGISAGTRTDSVIVAANADSQYYRWNVTQIVKDQIAKRSFGVRISSAELETYEAKLWATEDHADPTLRPYFVLTYLSPPAGGRSAFGRTGMRAGFGRWDRR